MQQKEMVTLAANSVATHAYVGLPCGRGKSMSWLVPILASLISGRHIGIRIVILPYKFLLGHMVEQARSFLGRLSNMLKVVFAESTTIRQDLFPTFLEDRVLPSLLFLNLDAAENLQYYNMERLQQ